MPDPARAIDQPIAMGLDCSCESVLGIALLLSKRDVREVHTHASSPLLDPSPFSAFLISTCSLRPSVALYLWLSPAVKSTCSFGDRQGSSDHFLDGCNVVPTTLAVVFSPIALSNNV